MNNWTGIGRLTKDPELRYITGSGNATTTFTLAIDRGMAKDKKQQAEAQGKPTSDFIRIITFGKTAENCANFLAKGRLCAVNGSIQTSTYKSPQGETKYSTDVFANHVEFLEWGDKKEQKDEAFDPVEQGFATLEEDPESDGFLPF
jgi:single-strand DNA-binding protein